jgi:enterochelin esterase-like enzyme
VLLNWPVFSRYYYENAIFGAMQMVKRSHILVENSIIESVFLERDVIIDCFLPRHVNDPASLRLVLINDGQDMKKMDLAGILDRLLEYGEIEPIMAVGIHANENRKMEYGIASEPDFKGRGAKAGAYTSFVLEELLPYLQTKYAIPSFKEKAFAGFSLGGLMALDIVWNHPAEFSKAGVFSGSLWWRSVDQTETEYDDDLHRIMHQQVRNGRYHPGLQFFFQCGNMDETRDRNHNGVIDSIDDTLDLIKELEGKGYKKGHDIYYLEMPDGRHDVPTWARSMPEFLKWGWGRRKVDSQ